MANTPTIGDDILFTTASGQTVDGLAGNDFISTTHNLAFLYGNLGGDTLLSGLAVIGTVTGSFPIETHQSGGEGNDQLTASLRYEPASGIGPDVDPHLLADLSGDAGDDRLSLTIASNWGEMRGILDGGSGNDRLYANLITIDEDGLEPASMTLDASGGVGNDILRLNIDNYPLIGAVHHATLQATGDDGDDDIVATVRSGGVATADADVSLDGGTGADRLTAATVLGSEGDSNGAVVLTGGAGSDRLIADTSALGFRVNAINRLDGGDGNDSLSGKVVLFDPAISSDFSKSGIAESRLYGGSGNDQLTAEIVFLLQTGSSRGVLFGGSGNDVLRMTGGQNNRLEGGEGGDQLHGSAGVDVLAGGAGLDTLWGGAGADQFVYARVTDSPRTAQDWIMDFAPGDRINVAGIDAGTASGDQSFLWGGETHSGRGYLSVSDQGDDSLVIAETQGGQRLMVRVADAADHVWSAGDFVL